MDDDIIIVDPLEEIYAIRQKISARYGHDPDRFFQAMLEKHKDDEAKGFKYVRLPIAHGSPSFEYQIPATPVVPCACESTDSSPATK